MDIIEYRKNKKFSILLVEDEEILAKIYFNAFSREGYRVLISKSGKSAINKYNEHPISLVILDLMLPDISGLDLLKHIRSQWTNTKVIVLTNMLNNDVMKECSKLGVNLFISKSDYTPEQIVKTIKETLFSDSTFTITNI